MPRFLMHYQRIARYGKTADGFKMLLKEINKIKNDDIASFLKYRLMATFILSLDNENRTAFDAAYLQCQTGSLQMFNKKFSACNTDSPSEILLGEYNDTNSLVTKAFDKVLTQRIRFCYDINTLKEAITELVAEIKTYESANITP